MDHLYRADIIIECKEVLKNDALGKGHVIRTEASGQQTASKERRPSVHRPASNRGPAEDHTKKLERRFSILSQMLRLTAAPGDSLTLNKRP